MGGGSTRYRAELSDAGVIGYLRFDFAIKIDFQRKRSGIENGAAVGALPQMALNLTRYLRCQPPFQILAN
jgi:hypothetical protein